MLHDGHRGRMIEKLMHEDSLSEHELLEILLYNAIPRKNTNELAHLLIARFRSLQGVFTAPMEDLVTVEGVGASTASYLKVIGLFYEKFRPKKEDIEAFDRLGKFRDYLLKRYQDLTCEVMDIFFLDKNRGILNIKSFSNFSENHVFIDAKEFTKVVAESKATAIVVAHNHPFASSSPSIEDDEFTKKCIILCSMTNTTLLDHCIVGNNGFYSYFNSGKLYAFSKRFSVGNILNEDY